MFPSWLTCPQQRWAMGSALEENQCALLREKLRVEAQIRETHQENILDLTARLRDVAKEVRPAATESHRIASQPVLSGINIGKGEEFCSELERWLT